MRLASPSPLSAALVVEAALVGLFTLPSRAAIVDGPPQVISGTLAGPEATWSGVIRIQGGNVTVPTGVRLRILPGTQVQVEKARKLIVRGVLRVEGEAACHVVFGPVPGAAVEADPASAGLPAGPPKWGGVQFVDTLAADNWITYAEVYHAQTMEGAIGLVRSRATIDHSTFGGTHWRVIYANASAPTVQYCTFPNTFGPGENAVTLGIDNVAEHIKAEGAIPAGQRFLVWRNTFGTNKGHNDVLDVDSGIWPGPIVEIRENFFVGAGDELCDLGGDVLLEGNVFQHVAKDPSMTNGVYANAASTGDPGNPTATVVCVRNIFWDLDHAISCRVATATIFENNTVVKMHPDFTDAGGRVNRGSAIGLRATSFADPPGDGAYLAGNIFFNLPRVIGEADSPASKTSKIEAFRNFVDPAASLAVGTRPGNLFSLGTGNLTGDPLFVDATNGDFHLQPGSPARGQALFGNDCGAFVAPGAWIGGGVAGLTTSKDQSFTVGGPGIFAYKWRLNTGPWSASLPIGEGAFSRINPTVRTASLDLTNLADGTYRLQVIGQDFAGQWQDEATPTESSEWTVCTPFPRFQDLAMAPEADPDDDGISTFDEYAFGLSFTQPDVFPISGQLNAGGQLEIVFSIPDDGCQPQLIGPSDVAYVIEVSVDLVNWTPAGSINLGMPPIDPNITVGPRLNDRRTITVTAPVLPGPPPEHRFLRVVPAWVT